VVSGGGDEGLIAVVENNVTGGGPNRTGLEVERFLNDLLELDGSPGNSSLGNGLDGKPALLSNRFTGDRSA